MRLAGYEHEQTYYLLKTEPTHYGWHDLDRDGSTVWEGVKNYTALKYVRDVAEGDLAFLYHTGKERRIVGVVRVASDAYPDPAGEGEDLYVFDVEPVERLDRPVTLAELRADPAFADWDLLRLPRLSVMPVPPELWEKVLELGRQPPASEDD